MKIKVKKGVTFGYFYTNKICFLMMVLGMRNITQNKSNCAILASLSPPFEEVLFVTYKMEFLPTGLCCYVY